MNKKTARKKAVFIYWTFWGNFDRFLIYCVSRFIQPVHLKRREVMKAKSRALLIISALLCLVIYFASAINLFKTDQLSHTILFFCLMLFSASSLKSIVAIKQKIVTGSSMHRTSLKESWNGKQIFEFANTTLGCIIFFFAWKLPVQIPETTINGIAKFCYVFLMTIFLARMAYMLFSQDPSDAKDCQTSRL